MRVEARGSVLWRYFQVVPTAPDPDALVRQVILILDSERLAQGMNQTELGRRSGLVQSTVSKYLDGRLTMNLSHFDALCHALGVNPGAVMVEADRLRALE